MTTQEPLLKDVLAYLKVKAPTEYTKTCLWWGELIENIKDEKVKEIIINIFLASVPE